MNTDTTNSIPPIPFTEKLLRAAYQLKQSGLPWQPHVGCFVWDRDSVITAPSPFPRRVYFILNLKRFLSIFGSSEKMREQLVWIPTWYQADQLCRRLGIADDKCHMATQSKDPLEGDDRLVQLYERITGKLEAFSRHQDSGTMEANGLGLKRWVDKVINEELGSLDSLPMPVQQHIHSAYQEASKAYLGWRRVQEGQPNNWFPPEHTFDDRLLNELSHFFSDYQAPVRSVSAIRTIVNRLHSIDRSTNPDAYQSLIDQLLQDQPTRPISQEILTDLIRQT